jgi:hypothetical protein
VFAFQFGREAGLFHADGNDIYWQLGNLFDHVPRFPGRWCARWNSKLLPSLRRSL